MYDEHDRYLDAKEATADAAIAREEAERRDWLTENRSDLLAEFAEAHPVEWAQFQRDAWDEYATAVQP